MAAMRNRSESFPLIVILGLYFLALALHSIYEDLLKEIVLTLFGRLFGLRGGELMARITEMAIPITATILIVVFLYQYIKRELALPIDVNDKHPIQLQATVFCESYAVTEKSGNGTTLYKNCYFISVGNGMHSG